jgi:hypothetical protein
LFVFFFGLSRIQDLTCRFAVVFEGVVLQIMEMKGSATQANFHEPLKPWASCRTNYFLRSRYTLAVDWQQKIWRRQQQNKTKCGVSSLHHAMRLRDSQSK